MLKKLIACTIAMSLIFVEVSGASEDFDNEIVVDVPQSIEDEEIFVETEEEPEASTMSEEEMEIFYAHENLTKIQITCYVEAGKPTCTGSYRMEGVAAGRREWLGYSAFLYKVNPDGTVGELFDIVEFNDIGYGAPVGYGTKSDLFKNRSAGTIETGKTIDIRRPNLAECHKYMKATYTGGGTTGSQVYMQLIKGDG